MFPQTLLLTFDIPQDDTPQPTLTEILRVVHRCTTSVDDLKEWIGGLTETVSLLRQDLQKIQEMTAALEGRISDLENQLLPLPRDTRVAIQQST